MKNWTRPDLKQIAHPYLFILKEGKRISADPLDFSLLMLHVAAPDIIKSPPQTVKISFPLKNSP